MAEAMVDPDVVVSGVVEKGKLLTLTTREALELRLATAEHGNLERLLSAFQLTLPSESQAEAQRAAEQSRASRWWGQVRAWQGWVIAGLGLLMAEMMLPGFFILWFGVGALVASLLAYLGVPWGIQVAVFLGSSSLLLVFSRTIFRTKFLRSPQTVRTNVEALKGRPGIVLSPIEGSVKPGLVKVGGEDWSAVCEEETQITKGAKVEVLEVVGNKVRVKTI